MRALLVALLAYALAGCDAADDFPPLAEPARYDPDAMADAALQQLDTNNDGAIGGAEFARCPALRVLISDKRVTRADLKARFESYAAGRVSVVPTSVLVRKDGSPFSDATCTLTPEPFMGPGFRTVTCTTDAAGFGEFRLDGAGSVGVPAGFYRLSVSRKAADGRETVPAALNAASNDVREITGHGRSENVTMQIDIRTRPATGR
jgi:hypothetical protein